MAKLTSKVTADQMLFVGLDIHNEHWHVTLCTAEVEVKSCRIVGTWEALEVLLSPYRPSQVKAVYEAGYFVFWLARRLKAWGAECLVTPPHLIPQTHSAVKTDRLDSRKLAHYLAKGLLRGVYIPSETEEAHRQLMRHRQQLVEDRQRVQNRIKAMVRLRTNQRWPATTWSESFLKKLKSLLPGPAATQIELESLSQQWLFLHQAQQALEHQLHQIAEQERYHQAMQRLQSIPGVGWRTALLFLLEIIDVQRFSSGDELASYLGLTPGQHSSGEHVRLGSITHQGKARLRASLVEAAWQQIRYDPLARQRYERLKLRRGGLRAIVAMARQLALVMRRLLLDGCEWKASQAMPVEAKMA